MYTISFLPLRTGVVKSPEGAELEVEAGAGAQNPLAEAIKLPIQTYKYMREIRLGRVVRYSGQSGEMVQRRHYDHSTEHR